MQTHFSPAHYVIHIFGGVRATARRIGRTPGAIGFWKRDRARGGCGGEVPGAIQKKILSVAKKSGLDITPNDLLYGRKLNLIK